jgi:indolepyruvate ferredoxin oxidoreductase alpha subunit
MAQMGGPVISTFSCGDVHSPVPYPGSADALIAMETSEVLRPGFLELLKPGGTLLLSDTRIVPPVIAAEQYPSAEVIREATAGYQVVEVDALKAAVSLGDPTGRIANVVLMGALSRVAPFDRFPEGLWLEAVRGLSPTPAVWAANYRAFQAGRERA